MQKLTSKSANTICLANFSLSSRTVRNKDEGGQAEVVWTCHEKRPRVCRKKDDGSGVTRKEKRETKEKIFRCGKKKI